MNCREHVLPELELSTSMVREALQAVLHTILFLRAPGPVRPMDVDCAHFPNLAYSRIYCHNRGSDNSALGDGKISNSAFKSSALATFDDGVDDYFRSGTTNDAASRGKEGLNKILGFEGGSGRRQKLSQHHDVDSKVDESIETFMQSLTPIGPELLSGAITLSFFERRTTRQLFGLVSSQERVVWEQWTVRVVVNNTPTPVNDDSASVIERQRIQDTAEGMLRAVLMKIFECVGDSIDHVPPVMYEFDVACSKRADDRSENIYTRVAQMPALVNLNS
mmetsp:Transcript_32943/g.75860  ORF Transcript_32943/g.75860 Transcript_32943/m.75860 type:complete len:277 (-) Transcript_32943:227-1057(-)